MIGVSGCGKSLSAKAIAADWQVPLLRLDVGKLFASFVGASEENMRRAIAIAESVAPVVLWVDEIEKGFPKGVSAGDSGTSSRVLATFLTWLQEKTSPVFLVSTANDMTRLPLELTRKGRFDEIFYFDLPSPPERGEILRIHLRHVHVIVEEEVLDKLVGMTDGFTGAEIEQVVKETLFRCYKDKPIAQLFWEKFKTVVEDMVPMSRRPDDTEGIQNMREQMRWMAVPASGYYAVDLSTTRNREEGDRFSRFQRGG